MDSDRQISEKMCKRFSLFLSIGVLSILIFSSVYGCGRSDPVKCTDSCEPQGKSRCIEDMIQVCVQTNQACLSWADLKDCSKDGLSCEIQDSEAVCSSGCVDQCETAGEKTCQRDTIKVCVPDESGCLNWQSVLNCSYYDAACEMSDGMVRCVSVCSDECGTAGEKRCFYHIIQECIRGTDGCLDWADELDCATMDYTCLENSGEPACGPCLPDCTDRECGPDPICGTSCGTCYGPTEVCNEIVGICDDVCAGKECGVFGGKDCGTCQGATEVCRQSLGVCEDVCVDKECGVFEGKYCGICSGATVVCRQDTGLCEDVCASRECGTVEGYSCGNCEGDTLVCHEAVGLCVNVCIGRECGEVEGVSCGTCEEDETCLMGQCYFPVCEGGMCEVPAGPFWMGCNEDVDVFCEDDEYPYHEVFLDAFEIDMYEVTQGAYYLCILEGDCDIPYCYFDPELHEDFPVVCVEWDHAHDFCQWAGKRLCTEAEWEKAARGTDGRRYPWGNEPASCEYAVMNDGGGGCGAGTFATVGSKPAGACPFGAMDMAGNVGEFVKDSYDADYYDQCTSGCVNPQGPPGGNHPNNVVRGGGYLQWADRLRTSRRNSYIGAGEYTGFRCCRSIE
jgi:formylglycine-generating enzyme required for sulfatase activity